MFRLFLMLTAFILVVTASLSGTAQAADKWEKLSVKSAMQTTVAQDKLDPDISFFMKGQKHKKVKNLSKEYSANKRSRKFGKTTEEACQQAFISALLAFQQRAQREGRNAVVDLYSITKDEKFESSAEYSCLVGGMMANVALRGKVADVGK